MSSPPAAQGGVTPRSSWMYFLVAVLVFTFAMMVVSFPVGFYTVFGTHLSSKYSASTDIAGVELDLVFGTLGVPIPGSLGAYFVGLTAIYLAFFVLAARQGTGFFGSLRRALPDDYRALFGNPLAAMMVLLGATSFLTFVVDTFQTNAGISTGNITGDPFELFLDFTLAPVLEETTFRVIMIGVPVLVISLFILRGAPRGMVLRALWRPSSVWDTDEEEGDAVRSFSDATPSIFPDREYDSLKVRALKPVVYTFLGISSLLFGYAHYASGSGWGPGKITEAALAGLFLGYLYIKYGFSANILLHWSVNYVGSVFSFLGQGVYGVPWTSATGSYLDIIPTVEIIFLLGVPSTYVVALAIAKRSARRSRPGLDSPTA